MKSPFKRLAATAALLIAVSAAAPLETSATAAPTADASTATPIKHFVFMMQGDRSFDNYFGMYPGADGIPAKACQRYIVTGPAADCVAPFPLHGSAPQSPGGGTVAVRNQYDGGRMDGFVAAYQNEGRDGKTTMGYYDRRDLATYWDLADQYTLFDRFFSSTMTGQRANRNYWVAGAAAPTGTPQAIAAAYAKQVTIFDRLQASGVSWKFYVQGYDPAQNYRTVSKSNPSSQPLRVPLLNIDRFLDDPALSSHIVDMSQYYRDLVGGNLPAVSYISSSGPTERSAHAIAGGQKLVNNLIGNLMVSKYWDSSAFMLSYDGSGGWFDHVRPPQVDRNGYGLRVPALLVSPYVPAGKVNHTVMDYTSALAFIEHNWQVAPLASRDKSAKSLAAAFDFTSKPREPQLQIGQPQATHAPLVSVGIVYWCYGLAAVAVLGAVAFAALRSRRRRPAPPTEDHPVREPAQTVGADS
ncbi:MAG: phospholipase, partial [Pseudonocardiales bacterium]|jgi:phospholipase C|nr:phospholipase [Pseudonocardiales bacterium]